MLSAVFHLRQEDNKPLAQHEAFQHATVGNFLGSSVEGSGSGFIRCIYTAKHIANTTVTLLCSVDAGCCERGCCPEDLFWYGTFPAISLKIFAFYGTLPVSKLLDTVKKWLEGVSCAF
uniref:Uncharacterized protein n=1 Tax=Setaria digitata TaxID=48799 RepID=A0A915Q609_9BILA